MKVLAHAKINLSLRILGKREDGFHSLETLMTEVTLTDTLTFTPGSSDTWSLRCDRSDLEVEDNLVAKAMRLLEKETGRALPLDILLEKRIPSGAGLGGGSSDAAATLDAVNRLLDLRIPLARLLELAGELGSDVPFFLIGKPCLCTGRGEIVTPCESPVPIGTPLAILKLPLEIPTPWAYQHWASSKEIDVFDYQPQMTPHGAVLVNDLERPAYAKFLILGQLKSWLLNQPEVTAALMTGSGSALFALTESTAGTESLIERARERYGAQLWAHAGELTATRQD